MDPCVSSNLLYTTEAQYTGKHLLRYVVKRQKKGIGAARSSLPTPSLCPLLAVTMYGEIASDMYDHVKDLAIRRVEHSSEITLQGVSPSGVVVVMGDDIKSPSPAKAFFRLASGTAIPHAKLALGSLSSSDHKTRPGTYSNMDHLKGGGQGPSETARRGRKRELGEALRRGGGRRETLQVIIGARWKTWETG